MYVSIVSPACACVVLSARVCVLFTCGGNTNTQMHVPLCVSVCSCICVWLTAYGEVVACAPCACV